MIDINKLVRNNILELSPYSCARLEYIGREGVFLDANENPYGNFNRYPDPYQYDLKRKISDLKTIDIKNIFLGNGSDEIIDLLFRVFCNPGLDKVLIFTPTYGMYEVLAGINDIKILSIPLNENFQIDLEKLEKILEAEQIKMIFICSPNNPTSNLINKSDIYLLLNFFKGIVVLDEAYIDFCSSISWSEEIENYPNLIALQTLSKAWGMAGARLGMAFSNHNIIGLLNKVKPPYNISTLNQQIVVDGIQNKKEYDKNLNLILSEKIRMEKLLTEINLVEKIYPSDANFLLIKVKNADWIYEKLIQVKLIIRNRNKVLNNCLRITIGTEKENDFLINELKKI